MMIAALILTLLSSPPSFHFGKYFRVDLRISLNADVNAQDEFGLDRARFGIQGKFLKHFQYEVERDFQSTHPWKDVFLDLNHIDDAQVKLGKFKIPFSMDALTASKNLDFVDRSRLARDLAPGRDLGVMLHGHVFKEEISYQAGVFQHDGENSEAKTGVRGALAYAARLTANPLKEIHIGAAVMTSDVPEGLNSLKEKGVTKVFVQGGRLRFGTEFKWDPGPFSIKSEWVRVSEARDGQSIRETDLPARISSGWYLSGTWRINKPLQLAGRYERDWFGSANPQGTPFTSPRAPTLPTTTDNIWTGGVNLFVHPLARIQFNGVHQDHWTAEVRFQFFL